MSFDGTTAPSTERTATPAIAALRDIGTDGPKTFTEEEWAIFFGEDEPEEASSPRWYRLVVAALILGLLGSSALIAWRVVAADRNDITDPGEIRTTALEMVEESPYAWLVAGVEVLPIQNIDIGGFVSASPPDGIVVIDRRPWSEAELAEVVHHEIGHLLDFSAYQGASVRRGGLEGEVWAECAAVDAGVRDTDGDGATDPYRCTDGNLLVYQTAISLLGEVCRPWGDPECREIIFEPAASGDG